jgi:hypothetical protein
MARETPEQKLVRLQAALKRTPDMSQSHIRINLNIPQHLITKWESEGLIKIVRKTRQQINRIHSGIMSNS